MVSRVPAPNGVAATHSITPGAKGSKRFERDFSFAKSAKNGSVAASISTDDNIAREKNVCKSLPLFAVGVIIFATKLKLLFKLVDYILWYIVSKAFIYQVFWIIQVLQTKSFFAKGYLKAI